MDGDNQVKKIKEKKLNTKVIITYTIKILNN